MEIWARWIVRVRRSSERKEARDGVDGGSYGDGNSMVVGEQRDG